MARIGKEKIKVGDKDNFMLMEFEVSVDSEGYFTTTLKKEDVEIIESYNVNLATNYRRGSRKGYFKSDTKKGLIIQIRDILEDCMSRELLDESIVLRYAISTVAAFGFTKTGDIVPNMGWRHDGELDEDLYWQSGTVKTHAVNPKPTGIQFYVQAKIKRTFIYRNGNTKTEYFSVQQFELSKEKNYNLIYIDAICSTSPPNTAPGLNEISYTEERAKLFVDMFKQLCTIAHTVAKFTEPEDIIKLAESGKYLMS